MLSIGKILTKLISIITACWPVRLGHNMEKKKKIVDFYESDFLVIKKHAEVKKIIKKK